MANNKVLKLSSYGKRCRSSCIHTKGGYIMLALSLLPSPLLFPLQQLLSLSEKDSDWQLRAVFILLPFSVVLFLFAPVYGLIGEYWMRAKVLLFAAMALMLGSAVVVVIGIIELLAVSYTFTSYMYVAAMYIFNFGFALYFVNLIQFACDQFQFASSSDELRNFVYWYFWIYSLWTFITFLLLSIGNMYINFSISVCIFVINIVVLLLVWFMKHHLIIEPAQYNNPIKLIWKVMKYFCKYRKHPVRRSAFTYGELPPSGLDIAKERYGGPFTTEQVEDVKIFWNILILLVSMFGYGIQNPISYVTSSYSLNNTVTIANETIFAENIILRFPLAIPYITALIYIPVYQLIIIPFFNRYAPNMLKRFWIGLVLVLLQSILVTIIVFYQVTVLYIFILLEVLHGLSIVCVAITFYEFILAQSPRRMLGLLLGIGFVVYNSPIAIGIIALITAVIENNEYRIFYIVITVLIFVSVICYTVVACCYRYRQRNELSDINERIIITQYTERYLDRMSTLQDESTISDIHIVSLSI